MEHAALALIVRAREGSGVIAGRVRVAMAPEFASHWLAPQLKVFRAKHPQIDVHILVGTRQRDLSRGEAELAVQSPRPRQKDLVAVRIGRTSLALYASKTIVTSARWRITSPETLRGVPLLTYTSAFQMLQEAKWFQTILSAVGAYMETNSTHALLAAARTGVGVAVLPRFVAGIAYGTFGDPDALAQAIQALPPGQRQAVELLKLRELSLKEASALTGLSIGALKLATHRAVASLRRTLRGIDEG